MLQQFKSKYSLQCSILSCIFQGNFTSRKWHIIAYQESIHWVFSKFADRSWTGPQSFWAERPQDRSFQKGQDRGHPSLISALAFFLTANWSSIDSFSLEEAFEWSTSCPGCHSSAELEPLYLSLFPNMNERCMGAQRGKGEEMPINACFLPRIHCSIPINK